MSCLQQHICVQNSMSFATFNPNLLLLSYNLRPLRLIRSHSGTTAHFVKVSYVIGNDSCLSFATAPLPPSNSFSEDVTRNWILETYGKQSVRCAALSVKYLPLNCVWSRGKIWEEFEIGWDFSVREMRCSNHCTHNSERKRQFCKRRRR
jgi:hypothetical protein